MVFFNKPVELPVIQDIFENYKFSITSRGLTKNIRHLKCLLFSSDTRYHTANVLYAKSFLSIWFISSFPLDLFIFPELQSIIKYTILRLI